MEINCACLYTPRRLLAFLNWICSLDMVSVGSDQQTLTIHLWDHGEHHHVTFSYLPLVTFLNSTKSNLNIKHQQCSDTANPSLMLCLETLLRVGGWIYWL